MVPRGFVCCDECEGKGYVNKDYWSQDADDCPSCSGSGLVPTEKLRVDAERAAYAAFDDAGYGSWTYEAGLDRAADAVLRKVAEHIKEDR